jgi:enterobactin synthetase component D
MASPQPGTPCELNLPDFVEASFCHFYPEGHFDGESLPRALDTASHKRKREYRAGRLCAFRALDLAGCARPGLLEAGPDRLPLWPLGWRGSISHSTDYAFAAAASSRACSALGVDIEKIVDEVVAADIRCEVMSTEEHALFGSMDECTKTTTIFSAKESLFKALYPHTRTFFDFNAARLVELGASSMQLELTQSWSRDLPKGMVVEVSYGSFETYVCTAVCIPISTKSLKSDSHTLDLSEGN